MFVSKNNVERKKSKGEKSVQKKGKKNALNRNGERGNCKEGLHNPTLPIAAQQAQDLPLAHCVLAGELQDSATHVVAVEGVGVGGVGAGELEADAVGELLLVEVGSVGSFEVGEVELLAGAGLRLAGLLRGWRGEVQVTRFVKGEPTAFPELLVGGQYWLREELI